MAKAKHKDDAYGPTIRMAVGRNLEHVEIALLRELQMRIVDMRKKSGGSAIGKSNLSKQDLKLLDACISWILTVGIGMRRDLEAIQRFLSEGERERR